MLSFWCYIDCCQAQSKPKLQLGWVGIIVNPRPTPTDPTRSTDRKSMFQLLHSLDLKGKVVRQPWQTPKKFSYISWTLNIAKLSPITPKQAKVKCLINTKQLIDKSFWSMLVDFQKLLKTSASPKINQMVPENAKTKSTKPKKVLNSVRVKHIKIRVSITYNRHGFFQWGHPMIIKLNPSCAELGPAQPQLVFLFPD